MKLILDGAEYDIWESINYATLGALDDLQEQSKTTDFEGVTDPFIRAAWVEAGEILKAGNSLRSSQTFRRALMGIVFLAKRRAGEPVTWAEVREIPYADAQLSLSEAEVAEDDAPKG